MPGIGSYPAGGSGLGHYVADPMPAHDAELQWVIDRPGWDPLVVGNAPAGAGVFSAVAPPSVLEDVGLWHGRRSCESRSRGQCPGIRAGAFEGWEATRGEGQRGNDAAQRVPEWCDACRRWTAWLSGSGVLHPWRGQSWTTAWVEAGQPDLAAASAGRGCFVVAATEVQPVTGGDEASRPPQPYSSGSHALWEQGASAPDGAQPMEELEVRVWVALGLEGRMHASALTLADRMMRTSARSGFPMLSGDGHDGCRAVRAALRPDEAHPRGVYFHENQLAFPDHGAPTQGMGSALCLSQSDLGAAGGCGLVQL